jgi:hypothetical protein
VFIETIRQQFFLLQGFTLTIEGSAERKHKVKTEHTNDKDFTFFHFVLFNLKYFFNLLYNFLI